MEIKSITFAGKIPNITPQSYRRAVSEFIGQSDKDYFASLTHKQKVSNSFNPKEFVEKSRKFFEFDKPVIQKTDKTSQSSELSQCNFDFISKYL